MKTFLLLSIGAVLSTYGREATISSKHLQDENVQGIESLGNTAACNNVAWSCGESFVICGQEGRNNADCICAVDITGHTQCVKDRSCSASGLCSEAGSCPDGQVCLKADNCCGKPVCVPQCANTTTTTPAPTPMPTTPDICSNQTWQCGAAYCGDLGPFSACYCGTDVEGNSACYMEESCSTQLSCNRNGDCPSGSACVAATCCVSSLCLPLCVNNTTPAPTRVTTTRSPTTRSPTARTPTTKPPTSRPTFTPAPTAFSICASVTWSCGLSTTTCGDEGPLGCYCNQDEEGAHTCIVNNYCDEVSVCSDNSDCPSGSVCTPTCCGTGNCFVICDNNRLSDPLSQFLPITAFSVPSAQEKLCAESYLECRETCSQKFGRCTSQYGECSPPTLHCAEQCKKAREECLN